MALHEGNIQYLAKLNTEIDRFKIDKGKLARYSTNEYIILFIISLYKVIYIIYSTCIFSMRVKIKAS